MSFLNDRVLDNGLTVLDTEATHLWLCSTEPTTYTQATSTYALGSKALGGSDIGAPGARSPSGRKVTVAALSAGSVSGTGTAAYWAIVDNANSRLLAAYSLSASQSVTSGNTFSTGTFDIGIPAPA